MFVNHPDVTVTQRQDREKNQEILQLYNILYSISLSIKLGNKSLLGSDNLVYSTSLYEVCIKSVNPGETGPEISSQF